MWCKPWRRVEEARSEEKGPEDPDALWELYDLEADRTEENDLAAQYPERVREMVEMYYAWERRCVAS